jgi:hypothetical protein
MEYRKVEKISKQTADEVFSSLQPDAICNALLSVSFHEQDWKWVQDKCLYFLQNIDTRISRTAVICLGHIARIHLKMDREKVISALLARRGHPELSGVIDDALDDINIFVSQ